MPITQTNKPSLRDLGNWPGLHRGTGFKTRTQAQLTASSWGPLSPPQPIQVRTETQREDTLEEISGKGRGRMVAFHR